MWTPVECGPSSLVASMLACDHILWTATFDNDQRQRVVRNTYVVRLFHRLPSMAPSKLLLFMAIARPLSIWGVLSPLLGDLRLWYTLYCMSSKENESDHDHLLHTHLELLVKCLNDLLVLLKERCEQTVRPFQFPQQVRWFFSPMGEKLKGDKKCNHHIRPSFTFHSCWVPCVWSSSLAQYNSTLHTWCVP